MQLPSSSHAPSEHPSLPSPTLTNPDMILPYDPPSPDSTSSTPKIAQRNSSSSLSNGTSIHDIDLDGDDEMKDAMQKLFSNGDGRKLQKSNRKLAEQRNGQNEKTSASGFPFGGTTNLGSSPTLHGNNRVPPRAKIVTPSDDYWKRFDSVESGIDGSPDEEHADYKDVGPPKYGFPPLDNEKDGFSAPPDIEDDDVYSHAAMSIRAEQILANAKKRLTNMEGNLNRARSTLHNRPASSMSSLSNRTPDPVSLYTIPQAKLSPSKHRQEKPGSTGANNKGHSRVFSETSVPSSLQTPAQSRDGAMQAGRSSSAMGSSSLNAIGELDSDTPHNWFWTGLTRNTSYAHRHNYSLPALEEDEPAPESFQPSPALDDLISDEEDVKDTEGEGKPAKEAKEPVGSASLDFGSSAAVGLTRARSTTQMRDLRDQMQDLKGKISSLKRRAREDSMTRRSMQSLRTPSPFTAAETWHGEASGMHQSSPNLGNGSRSRSSDNKDMHHSSGSDQNSGPDKDQNRKDFNLGDQDFDESDFDLTPRNKRPLQAASAKHEPLEPTTQSLQQTSDEGSSSSSTFQANETSDDSTKDSDLTAEQDSLYGDEEYHDTSPTQTGERHEDRPDAFDYETFFLHSGTGTLARKGHSRANSSHSSIYSVETTKPTYTSNEDPLDFLHNNNSSQSSPIHTPPTKRTTSRQQKERGHSRNDSRESISTIATFATATEGDSDAEDDDEWILQRPMAGAWTNEQSTKRKLSPRNTSDLLPPIDLTRTGSGGSSSSKRTVPTRKAATTITNGIDPIPSVPPQFDAAACTASMSSLGVLSREAAHLSDGDRKLVDMLVNSLTKVCVRLKDGKGVAVNGNGSGNGSGSGGNGMYDGRTWRRNLDKARRVLDDEMNGEVF